MGGVYVFAADSDYDSPDIQSELILTLSIRQSPDAFNGAELTLLVDGVTYTINGSEDLAFSGSPTVVSPITLGLPDLTDTGYEYRSFSLPSSNGSPSRGFMRAKVSMGP